MMLDIRFIRENLEEAETRLKSRGAGVVSPGSGSLMTEEGLFCRKQRHLKALRNRVSDEISRVKDKSQVQGQIAEMREVSQRIKGLDDELKGVEESLELFMLTVPNIPSAETPVGASEADNKEIRRWGRSAGVFFSAETPLGSRRKSRYP